MCLRCLSAAIVPTQRLLLRALAWLVWVLLNTSRCAFYSHCHRYGLLAPVVPRDCTVNGLSPRRVRCQRPVTSLVPWNRAPLPRVWQKRPRTW